MPRVLALVFLAGVASAQSVQEVVASGDAFLGTIVGDFADIAAGDDGSWYAAVTTTPPVGTPLVVIHSSGGVPGVFAPGPVSNLSGAAATLVNSSSSGDYRQSGTTITVENVAHGLLVGERVRLDFRSATSGAPPADGVFTVAGVPDAFTFVVVHASAVSCGSSLAPCGAVDLVRTMQPVDLQEPRTCAPDFLGVMQLRDDDDAATPPLITPLVADSGLFWNSTLLLREGSLSLAPEVGPGTLYRRIWRSAVASDGDCVLLARMDDPAVAGDEDALVEFDLSGGCPPALLAQHVRMRKGDPVASSGNRTFRSFHAHEKRSFAFNARGDALFLAALTQSDGLPSAQSAVVLNGTAVVRDFTPVPGGTNNMVHLPMATVDLNDLGDYLVQVKVIEGAPPHNSEYGEALLLGHADSLPARKFVQSGEPVPDPAIVPSGEILLRIGHKLELIAPRRAFPALVTNGRDVVWYGEWGHLDPGGAEITDGSGIFVNHRVVVRTGQTLATSDDVLLSIGVDGAELRSALEASPNGRYLLFTGIRGKLSDPTFQKIALFRVDLGESVPYGTVAQSTGGSGCTYPYPGATLECAPGLPLAGSTLGDFPLIGHNLHLVATGAPPGTVVALFSFKTSAPASFPCGTFRPPATFEILLGAGAPVQAPVAYSGSALLAAGIPPALLGSTWFCQAFYKDAAGRSIGATNGVRLVIGAP